jgi:hypothetical protein
MTTKRPKNLTDAGYEVYCDTVKLREVDLPVVDFEIDKLTWNFDLPFWEKDGADDWNLSPWDVINKIEGSSIHRQRVIEADLQFPIFLLEKNNRWLVVDGVHRLTKAFQANLPTIKAKILSEAIVEKYKT